MDGEKYLYLPTKPASLASIPGHLLGKLTPESRECIQRLIEHDEPAPIE
jgi:hypothetical protein